MKAEHRFAPVTDKGYARYQRKRQAFWDAAMSRPKESFASGYYHTRLTQIYRFLVPPDSRVLELGCGDGDLLAALRPARGVGVDFSSEAISRAKRVHPDLEFIQADVHEIELGETFDVIVLADLLNDVWDVQSVLNVVAAHSNPKTRVIINSFNKLWQLPIALARASGLAQPLLKQNWLSLNDIENLLDLTGFQKVSVSGEIMWPLGTPLVDSLFNRFLVKFWPFNHIALTQFVVARPVPGMLAPAAERKPSVSVIVPARNEAGHIEEILERVPSMGSNTELIFVEGNSTDDTLEVIKEVVDGLNDPNVRYYQQPGVGKGDAVRHGYRQARGEILMILDADMTVAPEDLVRFFDAIVEGKGEFINGVRLVYPMENQAMQFLNLLGNKAFSLTFSWLLRQPVKDTLCGTKVLSREAYDVIAANRSYFGDFDPFGDFDLLFGAAKISLKIVDVPIRYRQRRYGSTNIDRWRHGVVLLRMAAFAARKLRFT